MPVSLVNILRRFNLAILPENTDISLTPELLSLPYQSYCRHPNKDRYMKEKTGTGRFNEHLWPRRNILYAIATVFIKYVLLMICLPICWTVCLTFSALERVDHICKEKSTVSDFRIKA